MTELKDDYAFLQLQSELPHIAEEVQSNKQIIECSIKELSDHFYAIMQSKRKAKGFKVQSGSKLYWYLSPTASGKYKCTETKGGWPVYADPEKTAKIHYEVEKIENPEFNKVI